jgi:hypothetical protein
MNFVISAQNTCDRHSTFYNIVSEVYVDLLYCTGLSSVVDLWIINGLYIININRHKVDQERPLPGTVSTFTMSHDISAESMDNPSQDLLVTPVGATEGVHSTVNVVGHTLDPIAMLCIEVRALGVMCAQIQRDQLLLRDSVLKKIDECKSELLNVMDTKLNQLRQDMNQDIERVVTRMDQVENNIQDIKDEDHFNPTRTLVVTRLSEERGKSVQDQAQELIRDGLGLDMPVVRAKRLQGRNGRSGLVKAELPSQDHKIQALRRKHNLKANIRYEQVYIRSSQSHEERVAQSNLRLVIDAIPDLRVKYRLAGNGRLVEKSQEVRGSRVDPRPRNPDISSPEQPPPVVNQRYALPPPLRTQAQAHTTHHDMMTAPPYAPHYVTPRHPRRPDVDPRRLDMDTLYA